VKPVPVFSQVWLSFYRIVQRIPRGRVATYAQIAMLAGRPRYARHVGYALAALRGSRHRVPWQRVMGKRAGGWAGISLRDPMTAAAQRALLEREGVEFDEKERVSLERYGWRPRVRGARAATPPSPARPSRSRRRIHGSSDRS
jgi:methylated-DNA-protein-cysteine methyltransferase-like protein